MRAQGKNGGDLHQLGSIRPYLQEIALDIYRSQSLQNEKDGTSTRKATQPFFTLRKYLPENYTLCLGTFQKTGNRQQFSQKKIGKKQKAKRIIVPCRGYLRRVPIIIEHH